MQQSIVNVVDDIDNEPYSYVVEEDVKECFDERQVLVLEAPLGTNLDVQAVKEKASI